MLLFNNFYSKILSKCKTSNINYTPALRILSDKIFNILNYAPFYRSKQHLNLRVIELCTFYYNRADLNFNMTINVSYNKHLFIEYIWTKNSLKQASNNYYTLLIYKKE